MSNISVMDDLDAELNLLNDLYPSLNLLNSSDYYTFEKFCSEVRKGENDFGLIHMNIRSLGPKFDEIQSELSLLGCEFDAVCFTETWLNSYNSNLYNMTDYSAYHSCRPLDRRGGGIAVYIKCKYLVTPITSCCLSVSFIESLFLEIVVNSRKILLVTLYRPPDGSTILFTEKVEELLGMVNVRSYDEVMICGDFNYDLLNSDADPRVRSFLDVMNLYMCVPLISKPTRVTDRSATLLDNIFSNNPTRSKSGIILSPLSDHYPVFYIIQNCMHDYESGNVNVKYRLINDSTMEHLNIALQNHDFSELLNSEDVNVSFSEFYAVLLSYYNVCIPIKMKNMSRRRYNKPWINHNILNCIRRRQNLLLLMRQNKVSIVAYRRYRNYVTNLIRRSKTDYYHNKFTYFRSSTRGTWSLLNSVIRPSTTNSNDFVGLRVNDRIISDDADIADEFNTYFSNIGKSINESFQTNTSSHKVYLGNSCVNSFFLRPVCNSEIFKLLKSLKNTGSDINEIPVSVIKSVAHIISPTLTCIINKSFSTGIFPDKLKIARVRPIYKDSDKCLVDNHRPISVLPPISKVFERAFHTRLYSFIDEMNLFYPGQYGFRSNMSTSQAIQNFLQFAYSSLDNDKYVFSVFLDFRKAFDCVDHTILLSKLNHYGVRGLPLDFLKSYLSDRYQFVRIGNSNSNLARITHGVPQGSILGPLLFLLFINDLPCSTDVFKYILYADDSTLSLAFNRNECSTISDKINLHLNHVQNWLNFNKIAVNINKTKYVIFSYRLQPEISPVKMGNRELCRADCVKFLGINLDNNLTFSVHISHLTSKLSKTLGIFYKVSSLLPDSVLRLLYVSLFQPLLMYGIEAWYGAAGYETQRVFILQKKCIRILNSLPYNSHTNNYFKSMKILKLSELHFYHICIYLFKAIHNESDSNLISSLHPHSHFHDHFTRGADRISVPRFIKTRSQAHISYISSKYWNSLPCNIVTLNNVNSFKNKLFAHLLTMYDN